jgi:hypothetical protein
MCRSELELVRKRQWKPFSAEEKSAEIVDGSQPPEEARDRTNIEY